MHATQCEIIHLFIVYYIGLLCISQVVLISIQRVIHHYNDEK